VDHKKIAREQLLHLVFGSVFFISIAGFAVGLDLAAGWVKRIGVTPFTSTALELSAHALLVMDLVLFFSYILRAGVELVKGMISHD
jgi:hypothetical protein